MEAVRAFNNELSSLYECKPPVSRAKMAHVTKCAIKAIKFYKHVVQSVEKFIQKCKPEYKVPGLYVIDSVVRQSRHQFGSQKDVFAPRFTKNIIATFQNLFKCPGEERSKIVRVLNLWQKNEVFPSEIIQPLLDLAADPTKPSLLAAAQSAVDGVLGGKSGSSQAPQDPKAAPEPSGGKKGAGDEGQLSESAAESMLATQNDMLNTVTQLLQQTDSGNKSLSAQQQQLQQLQLLQQQLIQQTQLMQQPTGAAPIIDGNLLSQIQALTNQLLSKTEAKPDGERFNKKLLDFDYGESDDEDGERRHQGDHNMAGNVQTILNDTSLMKQIHQVSQTIQSNEQLQSEISEQEQRRRILEQQQAEFDQQISQVKQGLQPPPPPFGGHADNYREEGEYEEEQLQDEDFRDHQQMRDRDDRDRRDRRRRSRDRSRTPKRRRRSRSRSRDRRRRSRSRDRHRRSRSKDREREKQKEKERDRLKKALPPVKENCVGVCTTTIWIGHLNKFTQEEELKEELERYGPVENISMVPPRGCAYVVMSNRKDAYKAISRLRGYKLNGSALKTAWAQSTGMREAEYKEGWDVENGVKYIPYDCLPPDLTAFLDGAILDSESLPKHLKDIPTERLKAGDQGGMVDGQGNAQPKGAEQQQNQMQPQSMLGGMVGQPGMMPPGLPGMMPNMMMSMQRPLVPGIPPQQIGMPPRGPPQMMPGAPQLPGMPGAPVPSGISMSIANTSSTVVPQTLHNVAVASGSLPSSPAIAARPGFPPGGPPRFGFNPNLPPPGFRLPPPGFGMRPMLPGVPNSAQEPPNKDNTPVPKQPEMAWPPDSNEKDEEDEELNESGDKPADPSPFKPAFGNPAGAPIPPGTEQSPLRLLGPHPPGFPPQGPPGSPWSMRFGGPRPFRPGMPPMPGDNPDMFNSMPPLLGPPGPRFMGNRLGMPGSPGFPRPPMMRGVMRPPVSLLELDLKPPENFEGERFDLDKEDIDNDEGNEKSDNEENWEESGGRESGGSYPNNNWKSVRDSRDRNHDRSHREDDRSRDRSSRNRDRDRDRDRSDSRNRDRDRNWDRDREDRHRDRKSSRDRDRGRGDRDREWRKHDDNRESRGERKEERERERTRPSRWSNIEDKVESEENKTENDSEASQPVVTSQTTEDTSNTTEPAPTEAAVETIENVTDSNSVNMDIENTDMDLEPSSEAKCVNSEPTENVLPEQPTANGDTEEITLAAESESVCEPSINNSDVTEATSTPSFNGPITEDEPTIEQSCKLDNVLPDDPPLESQEKEDISEKIINKENLELEEGEISS